ncbi:MAG: DUF4357 domain-containing protein [Desulfobacteraceae bacterium]|nr:DUF4357 domain-containing protein [Desulfobacteraceae bacterium]
MNYQAEITEAKKLLQDGRYRLCSVQCGIITEAVLKELLNTFLSKADIAEFETITKELAKSKKKAVENLTLGGLCNLFEKTNAFYKVSKHFNANMVELNLINLRTMVAIRNKAQHGGHKDLEEETEADSYIIYGSILKLLNCFKLLGPTVPPILPKPPKEPPKPRVKPVVSINVCRNKASGKYFIYVQDSGSDKILLIAPDCNVRTLERSLFGEIEEKDEKDLLLKGLISDEQVKKLHEYTNNIPSKKLKPIEGSVYTYKIHGAVAKMIVKNKSYVILKDSTAIKDEKKSCPTSALRIKKSLIATGKLVLNPTNDLYVFTEDVDFKTPSAASAVISGTSTNGWICFGIQKS